MDRLQLGCLPVVMVLMGILLSISSCTVTLTIVTKGKEVPAKAEKPKVEPKEEPHWQIPEFDWEGHFLKHGKRGKPELD